MSGGDSHCGSAFAARLHIIHIIVYSRSKEFDGFDMAMSDVAVEIVNGWLVIAVGSVSARMFTLMSG